MILQADKRRLYDRTRILLLVILYENALQLQYSGWQDRQSGATWVRCENTALVQSEHPQKIQISEQNINISDNTLQKKTL